MTRFSPDFAYRANISPYVNTLSYLYYDALNNTWSVSSKPEKNTEGSLVTPDFIQLTFTHPDSRVIERKIMISAPHRKRSSLQ